MDFISNNILFICLIFIILSIAGFLLYKNYTNSKLHLLKAHKFILRIPLIGNFILLTETERFASTMTLLLNSGMNLDVALDESSEVFNNHYLKDQIRISREEVIEGKDFVGSLIRSKIFPDIFVHHRYVAR